MHPGLGSHHRLPHHKKPIHTQKINTKEVTGYYGDQDATIYETVYDDLSVDRVIKKDNIDAFTIADGMRNVDHDGIMRTFLDRYSTIMNHEQILLEQEPSPIHGIVDHLRGAARHHPIIGHHGAH